jgi:hypothetical protein
MRDRCANYWDGIVTLAEGGQDEAARLHVESCTDCADQLRHLRQIMAVGGLRFFDAPANLIEDVKRMMPAPERIRLGLLRSTTAWSGARVVAEDFQIVVGEGSTQMRLMYERSGELWQVLGKAPSGEWTLESISGIASVGDEGRFSFEAPSLAETSFTLSGPEGELYVPSAEELLSHGSGDRD